jgi:hypothetical protein
MKNIKILPLKPLEDCPDLVQSQHLTPPLKKLMA